MRTNSFVDVNKNYVTVNLDAFVGMNGTDEGFDILFGTKVYSVDVRTAFAIQAMIIEAGIPKFVPNSKILIDSDFMSYFVRIGIVPGKDRTLALKRIETDKYAIQEVCIEPATTNITQEGNVIFLIDKKLADLTTWFADVKGFDLL